MPRLWAAGSAHMLMHTLPFFSDQVRGLLDQLAASIGPGHMLMQGGARHLSKMNAIMTGPTGGGGRSRA